MFRLIPHYSSQIFYSPISPSGLNLSASAIGWMTRVMAYDEKRVYK